MQAVVRLYKAVDRKSMHIFKPSPTRLRRTQTALLPGILLISAFAFLLTGNNARAAFATPNPVSDGAAALKGPAVAAEGAVANESAGADLVAWVRAVDQHVVARRVASDGSSLATIDLSGEESKSMSLPIVSVIAPDRTVTVVWTRNSDQHLVAVKLPAGGSPGPVIDISESSVAFSSHSNAAVGLDGSVHVVWRNGSNSHAITRTLFTNGTKSATTDVSAIDEETVLWGTAPAVAVDAAGTRYFTYHRNTDCHIMLRSLTADGVLGAPTDLTQTVDKAVGDTSPAVATANGSVAVVWHRDGDQFTHEDDTVFYSFVAGGVSPGPPTQLSAAGDVSMREIAIAGSPDGSFGVTWQSRSNAEVFYRSVAATGAPLAEPSQISAGPSNAEASPAISIGSTGGISIAWTAAADDQVMLTSSARSVPAPIAQKKPKVTLVKRSVSLRRGVVTLKLKCSAPAGTKCRGTARLKGPRNAQWAKRGFAIPANKTAKVKLRLNRKARALLRKRKSVKLKLASKVSGGGTSTSSFKLKSRP